MRIVLISPKGPLYRHRGGIFKKSLRYKPLTLTTLAALVPAELEAEIRLIDEGIEEVDPTAIEADLVGPHRHHRHGAAGLRAVGRFPRAGHPGRARRAARDAGPGRRPAARRRHRRRLRRGDLARAAARFRRRAGLRPRYDQAPGLSLAGRPFPRRDLLPRGSFLTDDVFEATRGCVHTLRLLRRALGLGARSRSRSRSRRSSPTSGRSGRAKLIFVDLNLIADRDYAGRLFEALVPLHVQWYGLATTLLAEDRQLLLALAQRSGCRGMLMGLESISPREPPRLEEGLQLARTKYAELVAAPARATASRSRAASSSGSTTTRRRCS